MCVCTICLVNPILDFIKQDSKTKRQCSWDLLSKCISSRYTHPILAIAGNEKGVKKKKKNQQQNLGLQFSKERKSYLLFNCSVISVSSSLLLVGICSSVPDAKWLSGRFLTLNPQKSRVVWMDIQFCAQYAWNTFKMLWGLLFWLLH